jgi:hypothetical protein
MSFNSRSIALAFLAKYLPGLLDKALFLKQPMGKLANFPSWQLVKRLAAFKVAAKMPVMPYAILNHTFAID